MTNNWFFSKTKNKVLLLLFQNPQKEFFMREIERLISEPINGVREALLSLEKQGILNQNKLGNKTFFTANQRCLFFDELSRMVAKQVGLGARIINEKQHLGKFYSASLSRSFYQKIPKNEGEIDLFLVAEIPLGEVEKIIKEEGEKIGSEINYTLMSLEEFQERKKNRDPFLFKILEQNRLVLLGKDI